MSTTKTRTTLAVCVTGLVHAFATCVGVAALAVSPTAARAADDAQQTLRVDTKDADGTWISTAEITIHPAAEPRPALGYRLLPAEEDLVDGNAAIHYLKAMGFPDNDRARKRIHELLSKAIEEETRQGKPWYWPYWPPEYDTRAAAPPLAQVREFLAQHYSQVPLLAEAARRRHRHGRRSIGRRSLTAPGRGPGHRASAPAGHAGDRGR
jgi:hypothetical protein